MSVPKDPDEKTGKGSLDYSDDSQRDTVHPKGPDLPKTFFNFSLGGEPTSFSSDPFNEATQIKDSEGKDGLKEARKLASKADDPTTAAADPNKDLPNTVKQVDPMAIAQVLKNFLTQAAKVDATMNANSNGSAKKTVTNALYGALCILANKYSLEQVLKAFGSCLSNNGILLLNTDNQHVVKEALAKLIQVSITNGGGLLPTSTIPITAQALIDSIPPSPLVSIVPDLYIKQYCSIDIDPVPGFIKWIGPNGEVVYTLRNEPSFASADDHVYSIAEQQLSKQLDIFIVNDNLTPKYLDTLLNNSLQQTQNNNTNNALGNNAASNLMQLLPQLLGALGGVINMVKSSHLPSSVLNVGSVNESLEKFSKNMAMIKKMKTDSATAVKLPTDVQGLLGGAGGLGSLANIAGGAGGLGSLANLAGGADLAKQSISSISGSLPDKGNLQQNASSVLKSIIT